MCLIRPAPAGVAPALQPDDGMAADPTPPEESADPDSHPEIVHQFTVLRGMAIAMVIETRDWYLGLLQSALARVRLEGRN